MHIILIGNYKPDKQESMIRYALMLESGFIKAGFKTRIWWPTVFLGGFVKSTTSGLGKWLGYIDKWVFFPLILNYRLLKLNQNNFRFHVCDHSNAPYLKHLPADTTGITCHDVIAIRGGLGHADAYCDSSKMGKILQRWILGNLCKAKLLAAVSTLTLNQLRKLILHPSIQSKNWRVIYNALNAEFTPIEEKKRKLLLQNTGLYPDMPFLLHVGSGLPRKNRKMLLDMVHVIKNEWQGNICFAGDPIDEKLLSLAESLGIEKRIVSIIKPDHDTLVALYNACEAFIFPSFSEGFGWPLIEAQACGAPVIASNIEPMPEISGRAALHVNPYSPEEFAEAFLSLKDIDKRSEIIEKGFYNSRRFSLNKMIDEYLALHKLKCIESKNYVSESY
ncbi:glycosyltransferase family 4 protein [Segetibacter koreensis]|uniref:glycosyltransferase family 4 protein n=1 Tax=Segetibacter koreensis TaxID=398037 RepID=UPI0003798DEC|nr:glycosyltransferase family 1 protein [Segetibacter koreensis]